MPRPKSAILLALPSIPAVVAASTGITFRLTFHETHLAVVMAALAGTFSLIGVFLVSNETQKTIRAWIYYRTEYRVAAAKAFEMRRRIRVATYGRSWTASGSASIRRDAATYQNPGVDLPEIMRITRTIRPAQGRRNDASIPSALPDER
jgi:hypothetical protein